MILTFVSNYINHHQIPVSNELYRLLEWLYVYSDGAGGGGEDSDGLAG